MKKTRAAVYGLVIAAFIVLQCTNDYNPFENYSNAQAYVLPEACSKKIREGDTLNIFSTETLAVYTAVREKIDSFRIDAKGNRYWPDTTILKPSDKNNQIFLLSFWDTGRVEINVTTYRSNNTTVSLPAPLSYYVRSPLKQNNISAVLNAACTLSTQPVGDEDVLYIWRFGKDTLPGVASSTFLNFSKYLLHIQVGKTDTGSLWITDFRQEFRSPSTRFTYLFYQPSPPKIKCTTKGLHGDTVITGEDTLIFTFQVIDSSGQGLARVDLPGAQLQSLDSTTFYTTLTGMKQYSKQAPKVEIITATNKIGQTTVDTFYLCYEATGPHGDLVKFRLVNPPEPALNTRVDTLLYVMYVDNYSQNLVSVNTMVTGPLGNTINLVPVYSFSDSMHRCVWLVPLVKGTNSVQTVASIPDRSYSAETTLVIVRNPLAVDTTPPVITEILINGIKYPLALDQKIPFAVDSPTVIVTVSALDNESGIASVAMAEVPSAGTAGLITMTYKNFEWVSSPIAFGTRVSFTLRITVKNKTVGAYSTTTRDIMLTRRAIVILPPVTQ